MKKVIRWPGLAGFAGVSALIAALWFLLLAPAARWSFEKTATALSGLPVTVEGADVSWQPFGFTFTGIQFPDAGNRNMDALYIGKAEASVSFWRLLRGNVQISELQVSSALLNHPRKQPWTPLTTEKQAPQDASSPGGAAGQYLQDKKDSLPDPAELLEQEKENLLTLQKAEALQQQLKDSRSAVKAQLARLPSEAELRQYRDAVRTLSGTRFSSLSDFEAARQQLDQLKDKIRTAESVIRETETLLTAEKEKIRTAVAELRAAPEQDMQRLAEKYNIDLVSFSRLSEFLLGVDISGYVRTAISWYERIRPYLPESEEQQEYARAEGRDVSFATDNPEPGFWLQHGRVELTAAGRSYAVDLNDFSSSYRALQRPARLDLNSVADSGPAVALAMTFTPDKQTLALDSHGIPFARKTLAAADGMTVSLQSDQLSVRGSGEIVKGVSDLAFKAEFSGSDFDVSGKGRLVQTLASALADIQQFSVQASLNGPVNSLHPEIRSGLDKQISAGIMKQLQGEKDKALASLQDTLNQRASGVLGEAGTELGSLLSTEKSLTAQQKELQQLAATKLEDFAARQKREAEEKAAAEKRKAEEAARKKAAEEKRRAEAAAKKKLEDKARGVSDKLGIPGL